MTFFGIYGIVNGDGDGFKEYGRDDRKGSIKKTHSAGNWYVVKRKLSLNWYKDQEIGWRGLSEIILVKNVVENPYVFSVGVVHQRSVRKNKSDV